MWLKSKPPPPPLPDLVGVDPEVAEAIIQARRDVIASPTSARAWGELGMVLRAHDFEDEAMDCFRQAERLDPRDPRWPYLRGLTLVLTDPDSGIPCLERTVERCRDDPIAPRLRLAEALLEQGRLDEAETHLKQGLLCEPDNRRVALGLGRLALQREDWKLGLKHFALCLDDEHARKLARALRSEAFHHLGEPEQARAEQAAGAELPDDQRWPDPFVEEVMALQRGLYARLAAASSMSRAGRLEEAVALSQETTQTYPKSAEAWMQLGKLWHLAERPDRAEQSLLKAVEVDPNAAEAWFLLGTVQGLGRPREAADSFRRAIRLKPHHASAHFNLGHCLKVMGDTVGAAKEYQEALRCRPDYDAARAALKELEAPAKGKSVK
jgi:tetratricopeptide (TPR) repeat protein